MHLTRALLLSTLAIIATACGELPSESAGSTTGGSAPATVTNNDAGSTSGGTTAGETGSTSGGTSTGGSSTTTTTGGTVNGMACPTYAGFAQNFFTTTCSKCHSANMKEPNYQDLTTVLAAIDNKNGKTGIKSRIDSGNMPDGGPKVTGTTLQMIDNWMDPNCRK